MRLKITSQQLCFFGVFAMISIVQGNIYFSPEKDQLLTDMLLRDIIDRMGTDLADVADSYLQYPDNTRGSDEYEKAKELPADMPIDYEGLETLNPNPSIRDQEYLQHSTLVSHQRLNQNSGGAHKIQLAGLKGIKEEKSENTLPAYCTPPNPCPIGYTAENHCMEEFENTAAFSRHYQAAQDCMCDTEHMLDCSNNSDVDENLPNRITSSQIDEIVERYQDSNPYLFGEKLPIAAKKGINIHSY